MTLAFTDPKVRKLTSRQVRGSERHQSAPASEVTGSTTSFKQTRSNGGGARAGLKQQEQQQEQEQQEQEQEQRRRRRRQRQSTRQLLPTPWGPFPRRCAIDYLAWGRGGGAPSIMSAGGTAPQRAVRARGGAEALVWLTRLGQAREEEKRQNAIRPK